MKIAILGGGNVYALNFAKTLHELGIPHFGIGRSVKTPAFWQVEHDYQYYVLHLVDELKSVLELLDKQQPSVVVNFAAQGEGAASFDRDAHYFYRTNTLGLVNLAEALRHRSYVARFVQIGTSELYGSVDKPSKPTDPIRPTSPYAISKAAFDLHLEVMHRVHGFPMNIIRPSNAYCPGQQLHRIIPKAIICALSGQKLQLQGGGYSRKSYVHASDLSEAICDVIYTGKVGEIYNCGPKEPISIRQVARLCIEACGKTFEDVVQETQRRVGEDGCYWLDSSSTPSWNPKIELKEGIKGMVEWVKKYPELLTADTTFRIRP